MLNTNDPILEYVPLNWGLIHPFLYGIALKAVADGLINVTFKEDKMYWRRDINNPQLELGL